MIRTAAVLALLAGPVHALSCMPPDVALGYRFAAEAEERYVVLLGELAFDPLPLPVQPADPNRPIPAREVEATFTGKSLSSNGFTRSFSGPLVVAPTCWGPWCGGYPARGVRTVIFARQEGDRTWVEIDPCGTTLFPEPTARDIRRIETCHNDGPCDSELGRR